MLRSFQILKQEFATIHDPRSTIHDQRTKIMKSNWKVTPKGDYKRACDAGIFVSMSPKGIFNINRATWRRMGEPKAVHVLFDAPNNRIGLKPTQEKIKDAYAVNIQQRRTGLRTVYCPRVIHEWGLKLPARVRFYDADIDQDGILVCDLRTAQIPLNVSQHYTKKRKAEAAANGGANQDLEFVTRGTISR